MNIIEIKDLHFSYNEDKEVIKGLNLNIKQGSYVTILGKNGSGKSTLAKLILGLLEKESGEIIVDNLILNETNVYEIRNKIGIVFQNPDNQFIGSTVEDDIAFGLENHLVDPNKMKDIIDEFSKKVNMDKFLNKEPSHLSGGQKQRVAIAGVLAMSPSVIIFDEATSMLDPKGKKEINELILKTRNLIKDITIISITHDVEEAKNADEVVILSDGQVIIQDKPSSVFSNRNQMRELNLDVPFENKIINGLKDKGLDIKSNNLKDLEDEICQ